jgi:hypothetical protein
MSIIDILRWMFPNWEVIWISLGWVAVGTIASTMMNHQTLANKQLNALKGLCFTTFLVSWALVIQYYHMGTASLRAPMLGYVGCLLFLMGDWLAFGVHHLRRHPGGTGGWIWAWVADISKGIHYYAASQFRMTLEEAEKRTLKLKS